MQVLAYVHTDKKDSRWKPRNYNHVKGLISSYLVNVDSSERTGEVFFFDTRENLDAFKNSKLGKSIGKALELVQLEFE
ncbi:MAG: hypothetical protein JSW61_06785 [Candidatus Thorarchaeota archaeon]|nr:MAG: hypothetical protein JSW61_06785 [Candidatus Thorarchaeota archaeon]